MVFGSTVGSVCDRSPWWVYATARDRSLSKRGMRAAGVCLDSVAAVQAALKQRVSVFPCMLSGQPKAQLALAYAVRASTAPCMLEADMHACPWRDVRYHSELSRGCTGKVTERILWFLA